MFSRKKKVPHICGEENHFFEPRYNYREASLELHKLSVEEVKVIMEVAKRAGYVYDICVHCGKTIGQGRQPCLQKPEELRDMGKHVERPGEQVF